MQSTIWTGLTIIAAAACGSSSDKLDALEAADPISFAAPELVVAAALETAPGGDAIEIELEIDDDDADDGGAAAVWETLVFDAPTGQLVVVASEAASGATLSVRTKDGSEKKRARLAARDLTALIGVHGALAAARKAVPGGVPVDVELELEGNSDTEDDDFEPDSYEVLVYDGANAQLVEVEVDAASGAVTEIEVED